MSHARHRENPGRNALQQMRGGLDHRDGQIGQSEEVDETQKMEISPLGKREQSLAEVREYPEALIQNVPAQGY